MKLLLVRSGLAQVDPGIVLGQTNVPLAVAGFTAMQQLAASWSGPSPRFVFSSDLKRAQQSAQVFGAQFAVEPLTDPRLREINYGRWDGRTWQQAMREDADNYRAWSQRWVIQPTPDGESFADLLRRTGAWLSALLQTAVDTDTVLALAHQGSIRALLCHALGLPPERSLSLRIDAGRVSCIACHEDHFEVCYLNASSFQTD